MFKLIFAILGFIIRCIIGALIGYAVGMLITKLAFGNVRRNAWRF